MSQYHCSNCNFIWDLVWQSRHFTLGSCHFAKTPSKGCVIHPEHSTSAFHWCCESVVMLWIAMAKCKFCFGIQFANVKLLSDRTNVTRISYETKRIWTRLEIEELRWLKVVLEGKVFSDYQHISVAPLAMQLKQGQGAWHLSSAWHMQSIFANYW